MRKNFQQVCPPSPLRALSLYSVLARTISPPVPEKDFCRGALILEAMILKADGHPMQVFSHSRVASSMCLSAGKHGVPLFFVKVPYLWKELNFKERRMCADRVRRP